MSDVCAQIDIPYTGKCPGTSIRSRFQGQIVPFRTLHITGIIGCDLHIQMAFCGISAQEVNGFLKSHHRCGGSAQIYRSGNQPAFRRIVGVIVVSRCLPAVFVRAAPYIADAATQQDILYGESTVIATQEGFRQEGAGIGTDSAVFLAKGQCNRHTHRGSGPRVSHRKLHHIVGFIFIQINHGCNITSQRIRIFLLQEERKDFLRLFQSISTHGFIHVWRDDSHFSRASCIFAP